MARPYRILGENAFYHITSRGNRRQKIFKEEWDHSKFLEYVLRAKEKFQFRLYAYVLMPNHYHLLLQTLEPNLSKVMHYINSVYTTYFNKVNQNVGHLFQGRYKSVIVEEESYFKMLSRYIHLNPVKAKMVQKPEDYKWSSYNGYISRQRDRYIDTKEVKNVLGMLPREYKNFVEKNIEEEENIFKEIYAGSILGSTAFVKEKIKELKGQAEGAEISYSGKMTKVEETEEIIGYVCKEYEVGRRELLESKNKKSEAKKNCIYLLKRLTGRTNQEIGEIFNIGYAAVSKVFGGVEEEMEKNKKTRERIGLQISRFKG